jgi:tetratricopeptide (TPR) repeat protein
MVNLSIGQVRGYARSGLIDAQRGLRGEYRFSFQDLVLLRTARELLSVNIPRRRVVAALTRMKGLLPGDSPPRGMQVRVSGQQIIAQHADSAWNLETGQSMFAFKSTPSSQNITRYKSRQPTDNDLPDEELDANDWYELGEDLERAAPEHARDAYRHSLELDPDHCGAHIRLGHLLQQANRPEQAESHFRNVLSKEPHNELAFFYLGLVLEDLHRPVEALENYRAAIDINPVCAEAHYNLSGLLEQMGEHQAALHHMACYQTLTE